MSRKLAKGSNLGIVLMIVGIILLSLPVLGLATEDYWDHTLVKNYRGYDIYYFPGPGGLYGVDTLGTNPPGGSSSWKYFGSIALAEGTIDNWLDNPDFIESYRGWDIFQEPSGGQRYYAINAETGEQTAFWFNTDLDGLKAYIDELEGGPEETPPNFTSYIGAGLFAAGLVLQFVPYRRI